MGALYNPSQITYLPNKIWEWPFNDAALFVWCFESTATTLRTRQASPSLGLCDSLKENKLQSHLIVVIRRVATPHTFCLDEIFYHCSFQGRIPQHIFHCSILTIKKYVFDSANIIFAIFPSPASHSPVRRKAITHMQIHFATSVQHATLLVILPEVRYHTRVH